MSRFSLGRYKSALRRGLRPTASRSSADHISVILAAPPDMASALGNREIRDLELMRALAVLANFQNHSGTQLADACKNIGELSRDWPDRNKARLLLEAIERTEEGRA